MSPFPFLRSRVSVGKSADLDPTTNLGCIFPPAPIASEVHLHFKCPGEPIPRHYSPTLILARAGERELLFTRPSQFFPPRRMELENGLWRHGKFKARPASPECHSLKSLSPSVFKGLFGHFSDGKLQIPVSFIVRNMSHWTKGATVSPRQRKSRDKIVALSARDGQWANVAVRIYHNKNVQNTRMNDRDTGCQISTRPRFLLPCKNMFSADLIFSPCQTNMQ